MDTLKPATEPERLITQRHYRMRYTLSVIWQSQKTTLTRGTIYLLTSDFVEFVQRKHRNAFAKVQL